MLMNHISCFRKQTLSKKICFLFFVYPASLVVHCNEGQFELSVDTSHTYGNDCANTDTGAPIHVISNSFVECGTHRAAFGMKKSKSKLGNLGSNHQHDDTQRCHIQHLFILKTNNTTDVKSITPSTKQRRSIH